MSSSEVVPPPLPHGIKPLSHQVAGHFYGEGVTKLGFLETEDGSLLKPVQNPPRGIRELTFYQTVFDPTCTDPVITELRPLLPTYHGTCNIEQHPDVAYFRLEDITRKFSKPCIMDVKIGPITWDHLASQEKIEKEKSKYPPVEITGFQIIGIKLSEKDGTFTHLHRKYLRSLDAEQLLHKGLAVFFSQEGKLRKDIIQGVLRHVCNIENWFLSQKKYCFYASSLLVVYEAASHGDNGNISNICNGDIGCTNRTSAGFEGSSIDPVGGQQKPTNGSVDVRMIDFAHVFQNEEIDHNYLRGITGLKSYLNRLLLL